MFNIQEVMIGSVIMFTSNDDIPIGYAPCDGNTYNGVTTVNIPEGSYLKQDNGVALGSTGAMSTALPSKGVTGVTSSTGHSHTTSGGSFNLSAGANHGHNTANATARTYTHSKINKALKNGGNFTFVNISNGITWRTVTVSVSGTLSNTGTHSHNISTYGSGLSANATHSHNIAGGDATTEPNNIRVRYITYVGV